MKIVIASNAVRLRVSTPARPYEDYSRAGGLHAVGSLERAQFKSPGRSSAIFRSPSFSRRQAVGVVAYLNTGTLTAVNSCGVLRHWSSYPRFKFLQEPLRGLSDSFPVLSCVLFHAANKAWRSPNDVQRNPESEAAGA